MVTTLTVGWLFYGKFGYLLERLAVYSLVKLKRFRGEDIRSSGDLQLHSMESHFLVAVLSIVRVFILSGRIFFLALGIRAAVPYIVLLLGMPIAQLSLLFAISPGALGVLEGGWFAVMKLAELPRETIGRFLLGQRFYILIINLAILALAFAPVQRFRRMATDNARDNHSAR